MSWGTQCGLSTFCQEPDNQWDFFSYSPEATHQFTGLFGDRGIPATLRHTDGFGSHTFQWVNAKGERFWVKFHLALMFAAMFDRLEMLELLLSRGAASEHTDADGRTALDYARGMGAQRTTARLTELRQTRERQ